MSEQTPQYTMTTYYMGFLKKGPLWTSEATPEVIAIHEGHMANIRRMAALGKLIVAGPFLDDGDLRGVLVFCTASQEEAEALVAEDPAIMAERFTVEIHPWLMPKEVWANPGK